MASPAEVWRIFQEQKPIQHIKERGRTARDVAELLSNPAWNGTLIPLLVLPQLTTDWPVQLVKWIVEEGGYAIEGTRGVALNVGHRSVSSLLNVCVSVAYADSPLLHYCLQLGRSRLSWSDWELTLHSLCGRNFVVDNRTVPLRMQKSRLVIDAGRITRSPWECSYTPACHHEKFAALILERKSCAWAVMAFLGIRRRSHLVRNNVARDVWSEIGRLLWSWRWLWHARNQSSPMSVRRASGVNPSDHMALESRE